MRLNDRPNLIFKIQFRLRFCKGGIFNDGLIFIKYDFNDTGDDDSISKPISYVFQTESNKKIQGKKLPFVFKAYNLKAEG